jgi:hypothetical protein
MSAIKIHVTAEDIKTATQGDPYSCMVWRAVTRNLQLESETGSQPVTVSVGYDEITFNGPCGTLHVNHPAGVGDKIERWDDRKSSVKPFDFDLVLPDDWREQVQGLTE